MSTTEKKTEEQPKTTSRIRSRGVVVDGESWSIEVYLECDCLYISTRDGEISVDVEDAHLLAEAITRVLTEAKR